MTEDVAEAGPAAGRTRLLLTIALVLVVAVAVVLVTGQLRPDDPSGPTARSVVEGVLAEEPDAAVALPLDLPAGYRLAFGDTATSSSGGTLVAWAFQPPADREDLAVVQVCVAPAGECPAPDASVAGGEVPGLDPGLEATVIPYGEQQASDNALKVWRDAELTAEWGDLEWLDDPAAPRS